jgi:endonuclease YncB( thermonuclease family)
MRPLIVLAASVLLAISVSSMAKTLCVDINSAPPEELMRIIHIDKVRAAEAVEIRARRPFTDVHDLTRIRGIGPSRIIDIEAQGLACVGGKAAVVAHPEIVGRAHAVDGDTLDIGDERIRLIGIDAPEDGQTCQVAGEEWPCGDAATATLATMIGTAEVRCEVYGRDRYQRALAVCYAGQMDLNGAMVRSGAALAWYPHSGAVAGPSYGTEQAAAEAAGAGMWRGEFTPPWQWRRQ